MKSDRRTFIRTASAVAAGAMIPAEVFSIGRSGVPASDKIRIGLIGANGMGWSDLTSILKNPGVECVAIADVDRNVQSNRTNELLKMNQPIPKLYGGYRKMLENKDIDAVIIATPDH